MKINLAGIQLIKKFEGYSETAYLCPAQKWTVGYGHVLKNGETRGARTKAACEELLRQDLRIAEEAVSAAVKVPLSSNQFSALVSFTFNFGAAAFRKSTLLRLLNVDEYLKAADEFPKWRLAGGRELPGLVRRRAAERELFLRPDSQPV